MKICLQLNFTFGLFALLLIDYLYHVVHQFLDLDINGNVHYIPYLRWFRTGFKFGLPDLGFMIVHFNVVLKFFAEGIGVPGCSINQKPDIDIPWFFPWCSIIIPSTETGPV